MAAPGIPANFYLQTANFENYLSWDLAAGATSYIVQRSTDGVNFGQYATTTLPNFLDVATTVPAVVPLGVTVGQTYWYQVASANLTPFVASGTMTLTGQPLPGETFSLANIVFTAVAAGATGNQFNIGLTIPLTIAAIVAVTTTALVSSVVPSATSPVITFTAFQAGPEGNGIQFSNGMTNTAITPFTNGAVGSISPFTNPQSVVTTPTSEMSLGQIRLYAQQRADRVNSNFVTVPEWNKYINQSLYALYDILITTYEDYFIAPRAKFVANGGLFRYPLPNGILPFLGENNLPFIAAPFYKLLGVDLALNTANNAFVTINKYNLIDRNRYIYPNTASTIYGVFNLQYRLLGNAIEFIPAPSSNQIIQLLYIPRLPELLQDKDLTTIGYSGWLEYVILRAAIMALTKEESDTTALVQQIIDVVKRIEESAVNKDSGQPDTISQTRRDHVWNTFHGTSGGW